MPDPPVAFTYRHAFSNLQKNVVRPLSAQEGFVARNGRLYLEPGSVGIYQLTFEKKADQGCLLRVWFYGDGGAKRPNSITVSSDGGESFRAVARNGNFVGEVFDLGTLEGSTQYILRFEAANADPCVQVVLDRLELVVGQDARVKPQLPGVLVVLIVLLMAAFPWLAAHRQAGTKDRLVAALFVAVLGLALYVRWMELLRISGALLDADALGYRQFAERMVLFSETGFYSAQFGIREPLYIFVVKVFLELLGPSDTHVRFVSLFFSLSTVWLAWKIGKVWIHEAVGLFAAGILSIHPYLVSLSVRGLRAEFFTTVLLMFVYVSCFQRKMSPGVRTAVAGVLMGALILTRLEAGGMVCILLVLYAACDRPAWNLKRIAGAAGVCAVIVSVQLYATAQRHGGPLYPLKQHARFYANHEFAGQPGFPSNEEIAQKGMYTGPEISPFEYYFSLHSTAQVLWRSAVGFCKTSFAMPTGFAAGKGNMAMLRYGLERVMKNPGWKPVCDFFTYIVGMLSCAAGAYCLVVTVLLSFLYGVVMLVNARCWIVLGVLIAFLIPTAFVAYLGIDTRLTVHAYPLIALCSGYGLWSVGCRLLKRGISEHYCTGEF